MSAACLLVVLGGFAPSFYLRPYILPADVLEQSTFGLSLPTYLKLHGVAFTTWFVLVVVQTQLVTTHRIAVHRKLGVAGVAVAACAVATGVLTVALRDAHRLDGGSLMRSVPNLTIVVLFALCVGAAVWLRRRPADHKRLMVFASLAALGPAADRLIAFTGFTTGWFSPALGPMLSSTIVLPLLGMVVAHDLWTHRRVQRGTLLGFAAIAVAIGSTLSPGRGPHAPRTD